jgi:hypothetical protein
VGAPTTAGAIPLTSITYPNGLFLQYTSIKTATGTPRTIKAELTTGTIPVGLTLSAEAETRVGTGDVGISNTKQTITPTAATMIKNIGSCYTGTGTGNGAVIYYDSAITAVADLKATSKSTLTVTYTLSSE